MTNTKFWQLIETTGRRAPRDVRLQEELIRQALEPMGEREILSFEKNLRSIMRRAYTFDLMAASFIILSYASDDTFEDFRAWLVAQGRDRFERAVKSPEAIVAFLDRNAVGEVTGEALLTAAMLAYHNLTGQEVASFFGKFDTLADPVMRQDWPATKSEFRARYPALYDKFWNQERIAQLHQQSPPRRRRSPRGTKTKPRRRS